MKPKLFISYSRQQAPFIDQFSKELERAGYPLWLDFRSLVPAKPWFDQIKAGITAAEAFLLVVSKDSIASPNVETEWRLALELKERIILIVFEATPLPPELQHCEWVDFRGNFKTGLTKLDALLEAPPMMEIPAPPQHGFKSTALFWLAMVLSILLIPLSIPLWWTIYPALMLLPLPWQIYKRSYSFSQVTSLLVVLLPFIWFFYRNGYENEFSLLYVFNSFAGNNFHYYLIPLSLGLWGVLNLPAMQRRARPVAARPRFTDPGFHVKEVARSQTFKIDHAPEDGRYAEEMVRVLQRHGHRLAVADEKPDAIFVLISAYKKTTSYDPDHEAVFPVLLQAVDDVDAKLSRIQWIDFRRGVHDLDKLAHLLPEPERLFRVLTAPPTGAQEVMPMPISILRLLILSVCIIGAGTILLSLYGQFSLYVQGVFTLSIDVLFVKVVFMALSLFLFYGVAWTAYRALGSRLGGASAIYPILASLILVGYFLFVFSGTLMSGDVEPGRRDDVFLYSDQAQDLQSNLLAFGTYSLSLIIIIVPMLFIRRREFYLWFPRRQNDGSISTFEHWLLLYTPLRWRALPFHIMFHAGVILFLSDFMTYMMDKASGFVTPYSFITPLHSLGLSYDAVFLGLALILPCIHWLAHRFDRHHSV